MPFTLIACVFNVLARWCWIIKMMNKTLDSCILMCLTRINVWKRAILFLGRVTWKRSRGQTAVSLSPSSGLWTLLCINPPSPHLCPLPRPLHCPLTWSIPTSSRRSLWVAFLAIAMTAPLTLCNWRAPICWRSHTPTPTHTHVNSCLLNITRANNNNNTLNGWETQEALTHHGYHRELGSTSFSSSSSSGDITH